MSRVHHRLDVTLLCVKSFLYLTPHSPLPVPYEPLHTPAHRCDHYQANRKSLTGNWKLIPQLRGDDLCVCVRACVFVKIVENDHVLLSSLNQIPPCFFSTVYLRSKTLCLRKPLLSIRHYYYALVTFMFQEVVRVLLIVLTAIITAAKVSKHYWNVMLPLNEFLHQRFPLWHPVVYLFRD